MELVELEFPGHAWPWVMNSKVLLASKPGAGKSWRIGIYWCFRFLLLSASEEFNNSFVAVNMSKEVLFCHNIRYLESI